VTNESARSIPAGAWPDPDTADIKAARGGDVDAFERVYRRHHAHVDRTARWLLASDDVADVVQDVFVRAWRKLDRFDGRSSAGTWLHRLAVNVILRSRATRARWWTRHDVAQDLDAGPAHTIPPHVGLDLDKAIARLPGGAREVFVLFEVEGYAHADIGAALGISPHTSRSQLHRARTLVRCWISGVPA
jgi:RNA polymerase sigma-70 factor (ECF subfamily)